MAEKRTNETAQAGLTDEQIAQEAKFLKGLPYFNFGAMFMPAIWGPGHGQIVTILFYPLWLFCDNVFYAAYQTPSPLTIIAAAVIFVAMTAATLFYARMSQPMGWHRAASMGKTKEQYLATERRWAIGMGIIAIVLIALATWYNLMIRPGI